jgi:hypothetical protein
MLHSNPGPTNEAGLIVYVLYWSTYQSPTKANGKIVSALAMFGISNTA